MWDFLPAIVKSAANLDDFQWVWADSWWIKLSVANNMDIPSLESWAACLKYWLPASNNGRGEGITLQAYKLPTWILLATV